MNNREVSFFLTLKDEATKKWNEFKGHVKTGTQSIANTLGTIKTVIAGAFAFAMLRDFSKAAMESELMIAKTAAVLKSTGGIAGITANEITNLTNKLSEMSGVDDELIRGAENVMLTFTSIGRDVFPQAMESALDISAALGQDLQSSVIQIGKALQDPILGMTALRRVGVNFNEESKNIVKSFMIQGQTAKAQAFILSELKKEFGGVAEAAGNTTAGQMNKLNVQIGNLKEDLGAFVNELLRGLMPAFQAIIKVVGPALIATVYGIKMSFALLYNAILSPLALVEQGLNLLGISSSKTFQNLQERAQDLTVEYGTNLVGAIWGVNKAADNAAVSFDKWTKAQKEAEIQALNTAITAQTKYIIELVKGHTMLSATAREAIQLLTDEKQRLIDLQKPIKDYAIVTEQAWETQKDYAEGIGKLKDELKNLAVGSNEYLDTLTLILEKEGELKRIEDKATSRAKLKNEIDDMHKKSSILRTTTVDINHNTSAIVRNADATWELQKRFIGMGRHSEEVLAGMRQDWIENNQMILGPGRAAIQTWAEGLKGASVTWNDVWQSMKASFIDFLTEYVLRWAETAIANEAIGATAAAVSAATTSVAMGSIAMAAAPAAALTSLASFGGNAAPAMAGISSTYALATGLAIPKFHEGGEISEAQKGLYLNAPPSKEFPILVRGGETIRTERQEKEIQKLIHNTKTIERFHEGGEVIKMREENITNSRNSSLNSRSQKKSSPIVNVIVNINSIETPVEVVKKAIIKGMRATGLTVDKYLVNTKSKLVLGEV